MTEKWEPENYTDEYRDALEKMIEDKLEHGEGSEPAAATKRVKPTNVIDLVSVLQKSIDQTKGTATQKNVSKKTKTPAPKKRRKAA